MTPDGHDTDALIAALRSPALPAEHAGERAAVAAMLDVLAVGDPARPLGRRPRRGVAVTLITVAGLGVGGLVAAGPAVFLPAAGPGEIESIEIAPPVDADVPSSEPGSESSENASEDVDGGLAERESPTTSATTAPTSELAAPPSADGTGGIDEGDDPDCVTEHDLASVSDAIRRAGRDRMTVDGARAVDRPDCADHEAARRKSGDTPGKTGDTPGKTGDTPGKTGDTPGTSGNTPGKSGDTPGKTGNTPGRSGNTPGKSGDTPGKTGNTPGRSGNTPGKTGNTPGKTGNTPGTSGDRGSDQTTAPSPTGSPATSARSDDAPGNSGHDKPDQPDQLERSDPSAG